MIIRHKNENKNIFDKKARPINLKMNDKILLCENSRHKHEVISSGPYIVLSLDDKNIKMKNVNSNKTKIIIRIT